MVRAHTMYSLQQPSLQIAASVHPALVAAEWFPKQQDSKLTPNNTHH